ncbi:MAG: hypothetical protein COZ12_09330 [Deltaproteobacteria bacterium CG_4_10_14_3_um_filter_60_8]|nr:MAG: hypothetical protein AUK28_00940 [Desulfobacterales bacterium CG2_30_60_27]PIP42893.1 MAG: hypothetical protein COX17_10080 [Deltaproteobacteria bacterium CG23_combo_of_CG06-09_8_20_14_all_60_8]PIY20423.1 MAG: hypothetical protein COZ12_09330 [Deltaproteobacteria bacterium CG_4_10_14_3_um_filter_60_8]
MITMLDVALILLALLLVIRGAWVGFVRQIAFLAGLVLGFLAAGRYFEPFSRFVLPFIHTPRFAFLVTYVLLFAATYIATMLLGLGLKRVVQIAFLSWFDRCLGALFGLGKACLLVILLFIAVTAVLSSTPAFLQHSFFFPGVEKSATIILPLIQDPGLRQRLLPKQPAIPTSETH